MPEDPFDRVPFDRVPFDRVKDSLHEGIHVLKRRVKPLAEFKTFIARGSALELAIGVVIGAAFNTVVQSLVKDVLTPLISLPGKVDFQKLSACLRGSAARHTCYVSLNYGAFLTTLVSFLLTAVAVFFFVVRPLNHLKRWRAPDEDTQPTKECPECLSTIPVAARRCRECSFQLSEPPVS